MKFSQTVKKTGSFGAVNKQIRFATALALTRTAQDGQAATIASLKKNFDIRTDWLEPSRKFGIRIKPAKKNDLTAEIKTAARLADINLSKATKNTEKKIPGDPDNERPAEQKGHYYTRQPTEKLARKTHVFAENVQRSSPFSKKIQRKTLVYRSVICFPPARANAEKKHLLRTG